MKSSNKSKNKYLSTIAVIGLVILAATIIPAAVNGYGEPLPPTEKEDSTIEENEPKIETITESRTESIDYKSTTIDDDTVEYGTTQIKTKGVKGETTLIYEITYEDGIEKTKDLKSKTVTKQPVDEVIARGTKIVWHCVDATSYDRNGYNDNKCTNSIGETIYTYDSKAAELDKDYTPPKYGAPRYNF